MTNKEKKVIFTIIGIMLLILIIVFCVKTFSKPKETANTPTTNTTKNEEKYVTQLESGIKVNNSTTLSTTKTYKTIQISSPQFTSQNGSSVLLATLKNTANSDFASEEVTLVLLGENNEELRKIPTVIPSVSAGQTKQWNIILTADVVNAKDFKVEAK